jgi:hypothetical protein
LGLGLEWGWKWNCFLHILPEAQASQALHLLPGRERQIAIAICDDA